MKHVIALAFGILLVAPTALAAGPKDLIDSKYTEIQEVIKTDKTDEGVRTKITAILESFTDFKTFSRMTLKKDWKALTEEQRTRFTDRYRQLLHKSYVKHFKAGQQLDVSFRGEPKVIGDKAMVLTNVKSGETTAEVDYKLHKVGEKHMAYDIVIDEVSLMRNYRKQFSRILKRDGFDVLMTKIEKKLADTGDDSDKID